MKIALIGYGKMGKEIEKAALSRKHEIVFRFDNENPPEVSKLRSCDVAIDFSWPESAVSNIELCFEAGTPVVVGTTGWYDNLDKVKKLAAEKKASLLYASNCSLGVNIVMHVNKLLSGIINKHDQYLPSITESHHTAKKDAPSGTAISLATDMIDQISRIDKWKSFPAKEAGSKNRDTLNIFWKREGDVKGIHEIDYISSIDRISLRHEAYSREGFATGAVVAAEWLKNKKGVFSMQDMFDNF